MRVVNVERQDVEGVELDLIVMLPGMQRVEVGDTIDAEHDGFAVDDEAGLADLAGRLDDPRITVGKVVVAACDQPHASVVALQAQPVAVVLDLVEPVRTGGDDGRLGGDQKSKGRVVCRNLPPRLPPDNAHGRKGFRTGLCRNHVARNHRHVL